MIPPSTTDQPETAEAIPFVTMTASEVRQKGPGKLWGLTEKGVTVVVTRHNHKTRQPEPVAHVIPVPREG